MLILQEFWKGEVKFWNKKKKSMNIIHKIMKRLENGTQNSLYILVVITGDNRCCPVMQHNVLLYIVLGFNGISRAKSQS